jgi:hypothetical protein
MESSMSSVKTYLVIWLSGMVAGLVLLERWRRLGGHTELEMPTMGDGSQPDTASTTPPEPAEKPKVTAMIATGAKADVERARQLFEKVTPWGSKPAPSPVDIKDIDVVPAK